MDVELWRAGMVGLAALACINLWTIYCFRADKRSATLGRRRIPERDLLMLALIGGSPGAFYARQRFRHKSTKQPFSAFLWLIACGQIALIAGATAYLVDLLR